MAKISIWKWPDAMWELQIAAYSWNRTWKRIWSFWTRAEGWQVITYRLESGQTIFGHFESVTIAETPDWPSKRTWVEFRCWPMKGVDHTLHKHNKSMTTWIKATKSNEIKKKGCISKVLKSVHRLFVFACNVATETGQPNMQRHTHTHTICNWSVKQRIRENE